MTKLKDAYGWGDDYIGVTFHSNDPLDFLSGHLGTIRFTEGDSEIGEVFVTAMDVRRFLEDGEIKNFDICSYRIELKNWFYREVAKNFDGKEGIITLDILEKTTNKLIKLHHDVYSCADIPELRGQTMLLMNLMDSYLCIHKDEFDKNKFKCFLSILGYPVKFKKEGTYHEEIIDGVLNTLFGDEFIKSLIPKIKLTSVKECLRKKMLS